MKLLIGSRTGGGGVGATDITIGSQSIAIGAQSITVG
jgi:hypothetical protein